MAHGGAGAGPAHPPVRILLRTTATRTCPFSNYTGGHTVHKEGAPNSLLKPQGCTSCCNTRLHFGAGRYTLEGRAAGGGGWQPRASGQSIGHKRIVVIETPQVCLSRRMSLLILKHYKGGRVIYKGGDAPLPFKSQGVFVFASLLCFCVCFFFYQRPVTHRRCVQHALGGRLLRAVQGARWGRQARRCKKRRARPYGEPECVL